jgi:hypothetical protein
MIRRKTSKAQIFFHKENSDKKLPLHQLFFPLLTIAKTR